MLGQFGEGLELTGDEAVAGETRVELTGIILMVDMLGCETVDVLVVTLVE